MTIALAARPHDSAGEPTDAELVRSVLAGSSTAPRQVYERFAPRLYRCAFRITRDSDVAEDVVQETFIRAFGALNALKDPNALGAWLVATAVRLAYDSQRRQRLRVGRLVGLDAATATPSKQPTEPLIAEHVGAAIAKLSPKLRSVVVMYELEGYSHAEIAKALNIPEATSKTRLFQARSELRKALSAYGDREDVV